ncbi:MAG: ComEC/Rec2 family competence protein [candidate division WOR-3 bacterium]
MSNWLSRELGIKHAAPRALAAVALGIGISQAAQWLWLPAILIIPVGLVLARWTRGWSLLLVLAAAAFIYARARTPVADQRIYELESFSGTVVSEPLGFTRNRAVVELSPSGQGRVIVWVRGPTSELRYGDQVIVRNRIRRFDFPRNPGLVDWNRVLLRQGLVGQTSPKPGQIVVVSRGHGNLLMRLLVMPARRYVFRTIERLLPGDEGALLVGLLLGDRRGLPKQVQEAFVDAGIVHIMAVSGLNMAIVVGTVVLLLSVLRIRGWWRFGLGVGATLFYVALVGWSAPPVRSGLMACAALLAIPTQRRVTPTATLSVAGLVLLLLDPFSLFEAGTQLSFVATAVILLVAPPIAKVLRRWHIPGWLRNWIFLPLAVSLAASFGTAPLLLHHFFRFQPLGFLTTAVVVPLVGLATPIGFLVILLNLVSSGLAAIFAESLRAVLWLILVIARWFGSLDWSIVEPGRMGWVWVGWLYLLAILAVNWQKVWPRPLLRFALALGLVLLVWSSALSRPQTRVTFLDPGKGDAVLLEDSLGRTVLWDAGIDGTGVVRDYLKSRGIHQLDLAVITHPDKDHYGGLLDLGRRCHIRRLIIAIREPNDTLYSGLLDEMAKKGTEVIFAGKGTELQGLGYGIRFLWPDEVTRGIFASGLIPVNAVSLVAEVEHAGWKMLFTGDLDEPELLSELAAPAWLLKSPHHGSRKGNRPELYDVVRPEVVVVMGRYPTPARLEEWLSRTGQRYINTRRDGGCVLRFRKGHPLFTPN